MTDTIEGRRNLGFALMGEMMGQQFADGARAKYEAGGFAADLVDIGARNAFAEAWGRPGLDRRSRSLFTLGILFTLGFARETKYHVNIALENGLTQTEIEELIYQALVYAGYPAASQGATAIEEVFRERGLIK
ncbi:carboxymuconolactone decarboxylase family protein [Novosphingobium sp. PASSN1]|uniref:carboxymuconolactone decarboxylase family protein n=1 Tax=Novosphingobium sp. PASSN1 TaxID=2015561 RepID=UPI000BD3BB8F|nr:carboxymuconolactone decarboxylase family protein [Novosphingobium sp. PASSN1]OYU34750.1 MAG: carboxymuconolactone decarboxylase [Novosphingobium sp. PASSN1]